MEHLQSEEPFSSDPYFSTRFVRPIDVCNHFCKLYFIQSPLFIKINNLESTDEPRGDHLSQDVIDNWFEYYDDSKYYNNETGK